MLYLLLPIALVIAIYVLAYVFSHSPRPPVPSELKYRTNGSNTSHDLSSSPIDLSIIIPCYNETKRLEKMMDECVGHLKQKTYTYEIIVVDDKSSDGTPNFAIKLGEKYGLKPHTLKVIELVKNRGKGGAVTHGMMYSSGKYALFADADGATTFSDMEPLLEYLKSQKNGAIAIGSRAHMVNTEAVVKRLFIRNFLMHGLHLLVYIFGIRQVQDTQCGFKMFDRSSINKIFPYMHTERWIFDVEILLLAIYQGINMKEIPVNWQEVDGLKVDLVVDSINMAIDLVVTRVCYILGIYRYGESKKSV